MSTKRALKKMRSEDESPTPKRAKKNVPYKKDTPERQGGHVKGQFEKEDSEEDEPEQEDDRIVEAKEQMTYLEDDVVVIYDVAYLTTEDDEHWDYKGNDITFVRTSKPHLNSKDRNDGRQVYKMFLRMRTLELDGEGPCGGFWLCKSSDEKTWDDFHLEYQTASYGDQVDNDLEHTPDEDVDKEKDSFFDFSPRRDDNGYTL